MLLHVGTYVHELTIMKFYQTPAMHVRNYIYALTILDLALEIKIISQWFMTHYF